MSEREVLRRMWNAYRSGEYRAGPGVSVTKILHDAKTATDAKGRRIVPDELLRPLNSVQWSRPFAEHPPGTKRIGIVVCWYSFGGIEAWLQTLIPALSKDGFAISGMAVTLDRPVHERMARHDFPCNTGGARVAVRELADNSDVLIISSELQIMPWLEDHPVKRICVLHGDESDQPWRQIARVQADGCDAFAAVNPVVANLTNARHWPPSFYLPNVPHPDKYASSPGDRELARAQLEIPLDARVILWVGRLSGEKNPKAAIEAARHLPGNWCVIMAGGSQQMMNGLVGPEGWPERLRWAGQVERLGLQLAASDIFLSTAHREAAGIAILEAMAFGLPIVASPRGIPVLEQGTATVVDCSDPKRLAEQIAGLTQEQLDETRRFASATVKEVYSIERFEQRWQNLVKRVLAGTVRKHVDATRREYADGTVEKQRYATTVVTHGTLTHKSGGRCDVCIPYSQGERHLIARAVESILSQELVDVLIHVVADNCEQVPLPKDARIRRYASGGIGPYRACNALEPYFETEYLAIQDSDDISYPERLALQLWILGQGWHMVSAAMRQVVEKETPFLNRERLMEPECLSGCRCPKTPLGVSVNSVRTLKLSVFREVEGFVAWPCAGDSELDARLARHGYKTYHAENVLGDRMLRERSLSLGKFPVADRGVFKDAMTRREIDVVKNGDLSECLGLVRPVRG